MWDDDDWDDAVAHHGRPTSTHGVKRAASALAGTAVAPQSKRVNQGVAIPMMTPKAAAAATGNGHSKGPTATAPKPAPKTKQRQITTLVEKPKTTESSLSAARRRRRHTAEAKASKAVALVGTLGPAQSSLALYRSPPPSPLGVRILRVGTECSGMEPVMMALNNLGLSDCCSLEFCCEKDAWCKDFILQNHKPKVWNDDIMTRDAAATPACDLYVAGFPCQPFSTAGLRKGFADPRGTVIMYIINYLRIHRPRVFILENVRGLLNAKFAATFQNIMTELRSITSSDGRSSYLVSYRLVNTSDWGLPHHRQRVYIVGLWSSTIDPKAPFVWPRRSRTQTPIDRLLDTAQSEAPVMTSKTRERLQAYLASLRAKGHNPDRETWIIDIFGNWTHGMLGKSPCLTRTRAAAGGHWITTRSRLMSVPEMLRLQGMSPALNCVGITERQMGCMIGNAMSVNVLERLLVRLLPAVGLVSGTCLRDRWA